MRKALARMAVLAVAVFAAHSAGFLTQGWSTASTWVGDEWGNVRDLAEGRIAAGSTATTTVGTPDDATSFAFGRAAGDGTPVTWNACAPIRVVINPAGAPAGGVEDAISALGVLSETSGLNVVYEGLVGNALRDGWGGQAESGYAGWAPVLFGWAGPESGLLSPTEGGMAFSIHASENGTTSRVSGMVAINSDLDANRTGGFASPMSRGAVYLHELGHVVGLGHVDDPGQLMHPSPAFSAGYNAGDVTGLRALAAQPCVPAPAPSW